MTSDKFITATFSLNQYELNVATVGICVRPHNSGTYDPHGTVVTCFAAKPTPGFPLQIKTAMSLVSNPPTRYHYHEQRQVHHRYL